MKYVLTTLFFCLTACSSAHKETAPVAPPAALPEKAAPQKEVPVANAQTAACTNNGDKRTLEVSTKAAGCELTYTKSGKSSIVSSSSLGTTYCENSLKKIQAKLEKAGFECK